MESKDSIRLWCGQLNTYILESIRSAEHLKRLVEHQKCSRQTVKFVQHWYVYIYEVHNIELILDVIWNSKHLRFNYLPLMTMTFINNCILLKVSCIVYLCECMCIVYVLSMFYTYMCYYIVFTSPHLSSSYLVGHKAATSFLHFTLSFARCCAWPRL